MRDSVSTGNRLNAHAIRHQIGNRLNTHAIGTIRTLARCYGASLGPSTQTAVPVSVTISVCMPMTSLHSLNAGCTPW